MKKKAVFICSFLLIGLSPLLLIFAVFGAFDYSCAEKTKSPLLLLSVTMYTIGLVLLWRGDKKVAIKILVTLSPIILSLLLLFAFLMWALKKHLFG
jgi:membrane-associated HD superfamily phosphohydrolase